MGGHQRSVKTKSFPGQSCDEKNSVPYPSGNFRGCGAELFSIGGRRFCRILLWQKKCESCFWATKNAQSRNRTSDTRIFSPLLYQLSYLGICKFFELTDVIIPQKCFACNRIFAKICKICQFQECKASKRDSRCKIHALLFIYSNVRMTVTCRSSIADSQ